MNSYEYKYRFSSGCMFMKIIGVNVIPYVKYVQYIATDVACEYKKLHATCDVGEVILITAAFYGLKSYDVCSSNTDLTKCTNDVSQIIGTACTGTRQCSYPQDSGFVPNTHMLAANTNCRNYPAGLYLEVEYQCLPGKVIFYNDTD